MSTSFSFFDTFGADQGAPYSSVFATGPVSAKVQKHLQKVYSTLTFGMVCAALGSYINMLGGILQGGILSTLACIGFALAISLTPATTQNIEKRLGYFAGFTFFQGLSIGPLVLHVAFVDPSIITTAFVSTALVFISFSVSSYYNQDRSYLALGGLIGSGISILSWISLANLFLWSDALMNIQLYLGLAVFLGFVLFDTQLIISRAERGSTDFIGHATTLFTDFLNLFVRILVILTKNNQEKRDKNNRRR